MIKVTTVPAPNIREVSATIKGTKPLTVHRFSREHMDQRNRSLRDKFISSLHMREGCHFESARYTRKKSWGYKPIFGLPAYVMMRKMINSIDGFRRIGGLSKNALKIGMNIPTGEMIPLVYSRLSTHVTWTELPLGPPSKPSRKGKRIYRCLGKFEGWSMNFIIEYDSTLLTPEHIREVLRRAGMDGIGARARDGLSGTFRITSFRNGIRGWPAQRQR